MKKRASTLILAVLMTVILLFNFACSSPGGIPGGDGDGSKPTTGPTVGPNGPSGPGVGGPTPGPGTYTFENAAELAAAKDRLENADLSLEFVMTTDVGNGASDYQAGGEEYYSTATLGTSPETDGDGQWVFSETKDSLHNDTIIRGYDVFENVSIIVEQLAQTARETADWFIENVYAMDVAIKQSVWTYYMHHDKATDLLYVEKFTEGSEYGPEEYNRVTIYYDESGNEVIEVVTIYGRDYSKAVYCKDNYYDIVGIYEMLPGDGLVQEGGYLFNRAVAYKENGLWSGFSMNGNTTFSIFADLGAIYPDSNEGLTITTFTQTENGTITFANQLEPRHEAGNKVCGWNEETMSEDNVKVAGDYYKYYTDGVNILDGYATSGYDQNYTPAFSIPLEQLGGWDSIVMDALYAPEDRTGSYYMEHIEDIYLTVGGNKVPLNAWYSREHGFLKKLEQSLGSGDFVRLSDGAIIPWNEISFAECFRVDPVVQLSNDYTEIVMVDLSFYFISDNYYWDTERGEYRFSSEVITEAQLRLVEDFLTACGITSGWDGLSLPRIIINAYHDGNAISANIVERIIGVNIAEKGTNEQEFVAYINGLIDYGVTFQATGRQELLDSYVTEDFNEDKMNAFKQMGASILEIDGNISGAVVVNGEDQLDFEGLSVALPRSTLLSTSRSYGVAVTLAVGNADASLNVYQNQQFGGTDLTFNSATRIDLPTNIATGTYQLQAYYVRQTEDGNVRISDVVALPVYQFETFQREYDLTVDGNTFTYIATYVCVDGTLVVSVDIKDVDPPEIHINGMAYDDSTNTCTYLFEGSKQNTVQDLLKALDVYDRVDGPIAPTTDHVRLNGERVAVSKKLVVGETYVVSISDARGNVATLNVLIDTYAADDSDVNAPVFTFLDGDYDEGLQAYVYRFGDDQAKCVIDLFSLVSATDAECGYIPLNAEDVTVNGNKVDICDMLRDGETYVITAEDWNLNVATIRIYVEIMPVQ